MLSKDTHNNKNHENNNNGEIENKKSENNTDIHDNYYELQENSEHIDEKTQKKNELAKLNQLASDCSPGEAPAVLREVARLQLENSYLKQRNLRVWFVVIILLSMFFFTLSAGIVWYPKYRYIPTTDNSAICEVNSTEAANITEATIADYAKDAVINAYSYDYVNYRDKINYVVSKWFTRAGRRAFFTSLDDSGNLERVIQGRLILRASSIQVPQIEEEGIKGNQRYWLVQVPVAIEFYSGGANRAISRQTYLASVTIVQIPPSALNVKGIAVDSLILAPYSPRN